MDIETVKKVEKLAKLSIKPQKFDKISKNLKDILNYINILSKANVAELPDTFNNSGKNNVTVLDNEVAADHLKTEDALKNASKIYKNYFKVEKVIDI